jgi:signal transduction histidine kinase
MSFVASEMVARRRSRSKIFSRDPVVLIMIIAFALTTIVFYTTDFRNALESFFYDTVTRWLPQSGRSDRVIVIAIDDESIDALEADRLRVRQDHRQRPYVGTWAISKAAAIVANTNARAVALLMPEHVFPASGLDMTELVETVRFDSRFVIGTTGYNQTTPNLGQLPLSLVSISSQVAGYETFRSRSNAVIRALPYTSFRGTSEVETLAVRVALIADPTFAPKQGRFLLRHRSPSYFTTISLGRFLAEPKKYMDQLNHKIVVIGYTVPRDAGFQTTEQMQVNTPLTGPSPTIDQGISTTLLTANAIENLDAREDLRVASGVVAALQTAGVALLCGLAWEWGSLIGSAVSLGLWVVLILAHVFSYHVLHVSVPLADTFLATILLSVFAAARLLRFELIALAEVQAAADAKAEIAAVQSRFLTGFASWLKKATGVVVQALRQSQSRSSEKQEEVSDEDLDFYRRAFIAGEEFSEYLESIRQIPEMESLSQQKLRRSEIVLNDFIHAILRRFSSKIEDKQISVAFEIEPHVQVVHASLQLLDAILYNLISNAVKYSPSQTTISIRVFRDESRYVRIAIQDHGPGIAAQLLDRIFERFYRIRDERMFQSKGSGLGLYLCRYFAEAMNARIEVDSEVGRGSTFTVVLP